MFALFQVLAPSAPGEIPGPCTGERPDIITDPRLFIARLIKGILL